MNLVVNILIRLDGLNESLFGGLDIPEMLPVSEVKLLGSFIDLIEGVLVVGMGLLGLFEHVNLALFIKSYFFLDFVHFLEEVGE